MYLQKNGRHRPADMIYIHLQRIERDKTAAHQQHEAEGAGAAWAASQHQQETEGAAAWQQAHSQQVLAAAHGKEQHGASPGIDHAFDRSFDQPVDRGFGQPVDGNFDWGAYHGFDRRLDRVKHEGNYDPEEVDPNREGPRPDHADAAFEDSKEEGWMTYEPREHYPGTHQHLQEQQHAKWQQLLDFNAYGGEHEHQNGLLVQTDRDEEDVEMWKIGQAVTMEDEAAAGVRDSLIEYYCTAG